MSEPIAISAEERDLLYHRIMLHLAGIDRVWLAARHHDYEEADRLGRQVCDELQLVLDDLGWGETRGEPVVLTTPPQVVRRVAEFLREPVSAEAPDERRGAETRRVAGDEDRQVRELCGRLLDALDGSPTAPGGGRNA